MKKIQLLYLILIICILTLSINCKRKPGPPVLDVTPSELYFNELENEKSLYISNIGEEDLVYDILADSPLVSSVEHGTVTNSEKTDIVKVSVNRDGLGYTTFTGSIFIKSNGGTKSINFQVINKKPDVAPTAIFSINPTTGTTDQMFSFDASTSTDDYDALSTLKVHWSFESGEQFTEWTTTKTISHQYSSSGSKTITLEVKDSKDQKGFTSKTLIIEQPQIKPVVANGISSNLTSKSFSIAGNIQNTGNTLITQYGHCYSATSSNPTILDSRTQLGTINAPGVFTSNIEGLNPNTVYYVCAYATNSAGTAYSSTVSQIQTKSEELIKPTITIGNSSSTTESSFSIIGNIQNIGSGSITQYGHCYSSSNSNPSVSDSKTQLGTTSGTGQFTSNISGLAASTRYYVCAYATNIAGTAYSAVSSITTNAPPVDCSDAAAPAGSWSSSNAVIRVKINNISTSAFIEFKMESDKKGEQATGHITSGSVDRTWDMGQRTGQNIWFWWDTLIGSADIYIYAVMNGKSVLILEMRCQNSSYNAISVKGTGIQINSPDCKLRSYPSITSPSGAISYIRF